MADELNAELKVGTGRELTARDFAILIEKIFPGESGILYGCGISVKDANTIHINEGWLAIRGRLIHVIAGDIIVELPTSTKTKYVYAACQLGNVENPARIIVGDTRQDSGTVSFNESSGSAYMTLSKVTAAPTGLSNDITSLVTVIPSQPCIRTGTDAPMSSTPGREGDIYIQYSK